MFRVHRNTVTGISLHFQAFLAPCGPGGTNPPQFGVGALTQTDPLRFCHFSNFQAPDCLHYNAIKSYQPLQL